MSRWFRHYAGMMRDEKLVRVALKSQQPMERVVWVWGAILESAAEINDGGRYDFDTAEAAYFLRADEADIRAIETSLADGGRVCEGRVAKWGNRQFKSDDSAERVRRHRTKSGGSDNGGNVSGPEVPERYCNDGVTGCNASETETETETEQKKKTRARPAYSADFEKFWESYPRTPVMSKKEAQSAWEKLTEPDRSAALAAVAPFKAWLAKQRDHPVVHACRFLSQRRFDGFKPSAEVKIQTVFVREGTDAWGAWQAIKKTPCVNGGWHFPTEYPPNHKKDAA